MRNFEERKAEVLRRSDAALKIKKKKIKVFGRALTSLCLCICASVIIGYSGLLKSPSKSKGEDLKQNDWLADEENEDVLPNAPVGSVPTGVPSPPATDENDYSLLVLSTDGDAFFTMSDIEKAIDVKKQIEKTIDTLNEVYLDVTQKERFSVKIKIEETVYCYYFYDNLIKSDNTLYSISEAQIENIMSIIGITF